MTLPASKFRLQGQVALVTGGSRGLGFLLARELGRLGCRVAICGRDPAALEYARGRLERDGIQTLAQPCDVGKKVEIGALLERVQRELGPVEVLINNAGVMEVGPLAHMQLPDFEQAMDVMFWGAVYPTLAVYPDMVKRRSGHIVNIASIGGKVSVPHLLPYCSAKFATVGFSEGLRAELAGTGVKVLTAVPGLMRTGSYINAFVRSNQEAELTWFALGSSLPGMSMDAECAARQIVRAMLRGQPEVILSPPAKLLSLAHGVLPSMTVTLMGWVNQLILPKARAASSKRLRGGDVQDRLNSRLLDAATTWGRVAAERFQPPRTGTGYASPPRP